VSLKQTKRTTKDNNVSTWRPRYLIAQTCMRPNSSLRDVFRAKTSTVDVFAWHPWAAPLRIYGAVLRTPLPRVHYLTIWVRVIFQNTNPDKRFDLLG